MGDVSAYIIFICPVACYDCVSVILHAGIVQGITIIICFFSFLSVKQKQKGSTKPAATQREQKHGQVANSSPSRCCCYFQ